MGIIFAVEDVGLVAAARMLRGGGQVLIGTSAGGDGFWGGGWKGRSYTRDERREREREREGKKWRASAATTPIIIIQERRLHRRRPWPTKPVTIPSGRRFFGTCGLFFFCVLLIGQSSKVVVCRPIVSECVLTFRLLPALRWRDRNSIELATRGSPASVSSSRLCYYTASHDRNNIVSHGRRSPGDGVRDFLRQLG